MAGIRPSSGRRAAALLVTLAVHGGLVAATALPSAAARAPPGVQGIDVSRFQGRIDWQRVGETNIEFAFVQASRGSGGDCLVAADRCGPDEFYRRNHTRATAAGISVGAYHRAFTGGDGRKAVRRDARREARVFVAEVRTLLPGDLLPALDLESPFAGLGQRELRIWTRTWLRKVEAALGARPLIYTNLTGWRATGDRTSFARRGHRLWVANWNVSEPAVPAENWAGQGWSVWQYTSTGHVKGIEGAVDRNVLGVPIEEITVAPAAAP